MTSISMKVFRMKLVISTIQSHNVVWWFISCWKSLRCGKKAIGEVHNL